MNSTHDHSKTRDIDCLEAIESLYAWLDGELDDTGSAEIEHHLEHCRSCYSRVEMEKVLTERVRKSSQEAPPEDFKNRLQDLIKKL